MDTRNLWGIITGVRDRDCPPSPRGYVDEHDVPYVKEGISEWC